MKEEKATLSRKQYMFVTLFGHYTSEDVKTVLLLLTQTTSLVD